jgi:hypothetical protein
LTPASCAVGTSGSRRERLAAGDRQRLQHVALDLRQQRAEDVQPGLDLVAADGGHHVGRALEGHHLQVQPGGALEQLGRQVLRGADVGRADVELAGVLAPVVDQLAQRLEGAARLADDDQVERGQRRHGREGLERVVGQRLEQGLADGGAAGDQQQRVAVGRGRGHRLAGDHAAGAGLVVDDHRLAQGARHVLAHGARRDVGRAAGRVGHDDADRLGGKARRLRRAQRDGGGGQERKSRRCMDGGSGRFRVGLDRRGLRLSSSLSARHGSWRGVPVMDGLESGFSPGKIMPQVLEFNYST